METEIKGQEGVGIHPPIGKVVRIKIDGKEYEIQAGKHPVAEIKRLGHVPAAYELEEVIHGKLVPLSDDGFVVIENPETFISHPRDSASS